MSRDALIRTCKEPGAGKDCTDVQKRNKDENWQAIKEFDDTSRDRGDAYNFDLLNRRITSSGLHMLCGSIQSMRTLIAHIKSYDSKIQNFINTIDVVGSTSFIVLVAVLSKIFNPGWLTLFFPVWGAYILFYVLSIVFITKKIKGRKPKIFNRAYFFLTLTFVLSFLLLPDFGDGDAHMFFSLIEFDSRSFGVPVEFQFLRGFFNGEYFFAMAQGFAVINILTSVSIIFARLSRKI